MEKRWLIRHVF